MSFAPDLTGRVLRHERAIIAGSLVLLVALSWAFVTGGAGMQAMHPPLTAIVLMWWLMMVAMMLPSAAPAILLYARVQKMHSDNPAVVPIWVFLAGYLLVWLAFSIAAAVSQGIVTGPSMKIHNRPAESAVLIAAGLYQLSPLKSACLSQCRSPAQFISRNWRSGWDGALRLGIRHGLYCLGCCWMLMTLLFVGGIMNLLWIAGLTIVVAGEKLTPYSRLIQQGSAAALIVCGIARAMF